MVTQCRIPEAKAHMDEETAQRADDVLDKHDFPDRLVRNAFRQLSGIRVNRVMITAHRRRECTCYESGQ